MMRLNASRIAAVLWLIALGAFAVPGLAHAQDVRPPESAVTNVYPSAPGTAGQIDPYAPGQGDAVPPNLISDSETVRSDMWRAVRQGITGTVSIPDRQAGTLVQSGGQDWRNLRNGPISEYGSWALLGMIVALALFFLLRGRIRVESGWSGRRIERFTGLERFAHWLTASSFIVLALTGLNILYGRYVLLPILGPDVFAAITIGGKYAHNFLGFAFAVGVVLIFVLWVRDNLPSRYDLIWLAKGGGLFTKHSHPPADKFNAGQKLIFWSVVVGGVVLTVTGLNLMFPFFLADMGQMQLSQVVHASGALILTAIIIAHIYIGTLGMEGAWDAMGSGMVDENWAREHHSVWVDRIQGRKPSPGEPAGTGHAAPAE